MGGINSGRYRYVHHGAVEHYPAIDLRILRRAGLIRAGEYTYDTLTWRNQASIASSARVSIDLSDIASASMRIIGDGVDQRVTIECVPAGFGGTRCYFKCPVLGTRCELLHLAGGLFASRKAHRLTYASQSEDELSRARRKLRKLNRQVKGDTRYARPRGRNRWIKLEERNEAVYEVQMLDRERLFNLASDIR